MVDLLRQDNGTVSTIHHYWTHSPSRQFGIFPSFCSNNYGKRKSSFCSLVERVEREERLRGKRTIIILWSSTDITTKTRTRQIRRPFHLAVFVVLLRLMILTGEKSNCLLTLIHVNYALTHNWEICYFLAETWAAMGFKVSKSKVLPSHMAHEAALISVIGLSQTLTLRDHR